MKSFFNTIFSYFARVWRQAKANGVLETVLCPMDQFLLNPEGFSNPKQTKFIFVCSTTGQGEVNTLHFASFCFFFAFQCFENGILGT